MDQSPIEQFVTHGFALFEDAIDATTLAESTARLSAFYPSFEEYHADPGRHSALGDGQFGGLRLWPMNDLVLDLLPLDDRLVALAERLIGSPDLRLLRAGYQAKYAGTADFDQVLHYDYPNHSLVVPARDDIVGFFLYLSDVTDELGPTALVSDTFSGEVAPERTHLDPKLWPRFYEVEQLAVGKAGSVLAYRSTTYHRGTAIIADVGTRLTLGFAFGHPSSSTGYSSFPRLGEETGLVRAVPEMTPRQRELLGFPAQGDGYWTPENLDAVTRRYPGLDPTPYVRAHGD